MDAAIEAAKVSLVVILTLIVEPWLAALNKNVPPFVWYLITILVTALVLEVLYAITFRKAVLAVEWMVEGETDARSEIVADIDSATGETVDAFAVRVRVVKSKGLGGVAIRHVAKRGLRLVMHAPHVQMSVVVDDSDLDGFNRALTTRDVARCGFSMVLPAPVPKDTWATARIRFRGRTKHHLAYGLNHSVEAGEKRSFARLCVKLIDIECRAVSLREHWS